MTKNTYGTGSFVLMNVGTTVPAAGRGAAHHRGVDGVGDRTAGTTRLEGSIFVTGAAVQWLRDGLGIIETAGDRTAGRLVRRPEGVYLVPAFTGLGSPWWDPYARGTIVGITRGTTAATSPVVVEAMAFQTRDVVEAMAAAVGPPVAELRADGGASAMDLLLQLQADQLGVPVARPVVQETTALGAAYLAGLAEGVWSDPTTCGAGGSSTPS